MNKQQRIIKTINTQNLTENIQKILTLDSWKEIIWVLKADAYSHGIKIVSQTLHDLNQQKYGVYEMQEAKILDELYSDVSIFIFDGLTESEWADFTTINSFKNKLIICLNKIEDLDKIQNITNPNIEYHVFIETGFHWYGVQNVDEFCEAAKSKKVNISGVCSHFIQSDQPDSDITLSQIKKFNEEVESVRHYFPNVKTHLGNSNALVHKLALGTDFYRVGRMMYGGKFGNEVFKQVMSIKVEVLQVKEVKSGETISYDANFTADEDTRIAVLAGGYLYGIDRRLSNIGKFYYENKILNILGTVAMNTTVVDIGNLDIEAGDWVTFTDDIDEIRVTDIAKEIGVIEHEFYLRTSLISSIVG